MQPPITIAGFFPRQRDQSTGIESSLSTRRRRLGGLPEGELIYADNVAEDFPVLVSHRYGLKGRLDTLVRTESGEFNPLERKKSLRRGVDLMTAT